METEKQHIQHIEAQPDAPTQAVEQAHLLAQQDYWDSFQRLTAQVERDSRRIDALAGKLSAVMSMKEIRMQHVEDAVAKALVRIVEVDEILMKVEHQQGKMTVMSRKP